MKLHTLLFASLLFTGCLADREGSKRHKITIADKLPAPTDAPSTEYIGRFDSKEAADDHAAEVTAAGGQVKALDVEGRILKVSASQAATTTLRVDESTDVAPNAKFQIARSRDIKDSPLSQNDAGSFLTARDVTGVTELIERFPSADGRGTKVAVFDTGVEFGLRGISDVVDNQPKLEGFYDFSEFGKVTATVFQGEQTAPYQVDRYSLSFDRHVNVQVRASGILSEKALAKAYLTETIDLDGNGAFDDEFPYIIATDAEGITRVYVDLDSNGVLNTDGTEDLTDFNSTQKYVLFNRESSPSGSYPLAVTITSQTELQFHVVRGGHGTSCAVIIGGDGFANGNLTGMAPKTRFLTYTLDVIGQDVYTMEQFLAMFLHAKEQQVDAISISWGFTTSDLASARFFADFLDKEIAAAGIIIGIAAGNEGPALTSGSATDYIPRHGFGVGAMISEVQARNVYGWNGELSDSVIWYSSIGPTRGGRQMPDVISPLMSLVRGKRDSGDRPFYPFGGTSSATPALIGSVTALVSQLKQEGESINARLIKLAVQESAASLEGINTIRQGAGLINVNRAYDLYKQLIAEYKAAQADSTKQTSFAYELRAGITMNGRQESGEGISLTSFKSREMVTISLSEESQALIDRATFAEPLAISHTADFLKTADVVVLQSSGAKVGVVFDATKLSVPGTYLDTLVFKRSKDGLPLLRVPVVVQIGNDVDHQGNLATVNETVAPFDIVRRPFALSGPSAVSFDGLSHDLEGGHLGYMGFFISSPEGHLVAEHWIDQDRPVKSITFQSPTLPAGAYELIVFRGFNSRGGAILTSVSLSGVLRLPFTKVEAVQQGSTSIDFALSSVAPISIRKATLELTSDTIAVDLQRDLTAPRKGYFGRIEQPLQESIKIGLRQSNFDRTLDDHMHMSLAILDTESGDVLYRGWIEYREAGAPLADITLHRPSNDVTIVAYPNIVNWADITTQSVSLEIETAKADPIVLESDRSIELTPGAVSTVSLPKTADQLLQGTGTLTIFDQSGEKIESSPVDLR